MTVLELHGEGYPIYVVAENIAYFYESFDLPGKTEIWMADGRIQALYVLDTPAAITEMLSSVSGMVPLSSAR